MTCPTIITGDRFIVRVLEHVDCQSRLLGSYGFESLSQPGSTASIAITGLLTIFVALYGLRLLFGSPLVARDVVLDVIKVGIVLTLAFSWPAFRTVIYDVVLDGPAAVTLQIAPASLQADGAGLADRVQAVDSAMVRLSELGTGRNTGQYLQSEDPASRSAGAAVDEGVGFGYARVVWIAGLLGSLALLRMAAGILLALAPLAAGLLLFDATRGIFVGWAKGLALTIVGTIGVSIAVALQVAVLDPWLTDALRARALGYAVPAAPTELLAMTLAFAFVEFGMIWMMARVAWYRGGIAVPSHASAIMPSLIRNSPVQPLRFEYVGSSHRVNRIVDHLETRMRKEQDAIVGSGRRLTLANRNDDAGPASSSLLHGPTEVPRMGDTWRRAAMRRGTRSTIDRERQ